MSKLKTIFNVLNGGPRVFFSTVYDKIRYWKLLRMLSDTQFISLTYWVHFGNFLDLNNPKTFNEKLQWLKLNNRKKNHITIVDKCASKQYVSNIIGDEYIIKNYGKWDNFDDINFNILPQKFVLKCNHDSGSVVICKNKEELNWSKIKKKIEKSLKLNLFWWGREWPYKDVKPCIFAEELLEDTNDGDLKDYKFFCFNGKVKCFKIDFGRFTNHHANYYDINGSLLPISEKVCTALREHKLTLPKQLDKMILLAEKLSQGEPFLRVDFYNINDKIYFGELTFYPASGLSPFEDNNADELMGSWLNLELEQQCTNSFSNSSF